MMQGTCSYVSNIHRGDFNFCRVATWVSNVIFVKKRTKLKFCVTFVHLFSKKVNNALWMGDLGTLGTFNSGQ